MPTIRNEELVIVPASTASTVSTFHNTDASAKVYNHTYVTGNARLIQGDVHFYNAGSNSVLRASTSFLGLYFGRRQSLLVTTRKRSRFSLPLLLTLTVDRVTTIWAQGKDISRHFRVALLNHYMLYGGYCFDRTGGLYLYRVHYRHIIREDAPIISACRSGRLDLVRRLFLEHRASVNDVTVDDRSPLFYAIDAGHVDIVQVLLLCGADPNQTFGSHQTSPLSWALYKRNHDMVRALINAGADLHYIARNGWSILYTLWIDEIHPQPSCVDFLQILQTQSPDVLDLSGPPSIDEKGWPLFSRVACCRTSDELDFLIRNGADVHWANDFGWNAVFEAVSGAKLENLQLLTRYFPNYLTLRDSLGQTLLHWAAQSSFETHRHVTQFLLGQGADWQAKVAIARAPLTTEYAGLTPAEMARLTGPIFEQHFLQLVHETV